MDIHIISLLLGAFVGILLSLTGAGGGVVSVPLLVFTLHLSIAKASPIGLLAVMMAAFVGAIFGLRAGVVRYKAAGLMALCGIIFSPLGLWMAQKLPNAWLTVLFACLLAFVAIRMLLQLNRELDELGWVDERPKPPCQLDQMIGKLRWTAPCARSIMMAGSISGFLSGLIGVGGGFVIVPALREFTDLDIKSIVATSLASITLVSAGGVLVASSTGLIDWGNAWPFAFGSAVGMLLGRSLANKMSPTFVHKSFAIFALLVAFGLILKLFI